MNNFEKFLSEHELKSSILLEGKKTLYIDKYKNKENGKIIYTVLFNNSMNHFNFYTEEAFDLLRLGMDFLSTTKKGQNLPKRKYNLYLIEGFNKKATQAVKLLCSIFKNITLS